MVAPGDIRWRLSSEASKRATRLRDKIGEDSYADSKGALKEFLCGYFAAEGECSRKQGASVSPLGAGGAGRKRLKVRWVLPGGGKSGGLRIIADVDCANRDVLLQVIEIRKAVGKV